MNTPINAPAVLPSTTTGNVTAASAYAAGNQVGPLLTFYNVFGPNASGMIQGARLRLKSVQTAEFDLYLFDSNPAGSAWADKTNPAIVAADVPRCVGMIPFTQASSGLGTHTIYEANGLAKPLSAVNVLYGVIVTKGTPTFTAISDILGVDLLSLPD